MKEGFLAFIALLSAGTSSLLAQSKYAALNHGEIQIAATKDGGCEDGYSFVFVNTTKHNVDIHYFVKRLSGEWSSVYGVDNMIPGQGYKRGACETDGTLVLFVKETGSGDRFPNMYQIDDWKAKDAAAHKTKQ